MDVRSCHGVRRPRRLFQAAPVDAGCCSPPSRSTSKPPWQPAKAPRTSTSKPRLATAASGFRVLFLSRILREKGIYIAIDAFASFQRAQPGQPISLHIAGSGPELEAVRAYVGQKAVTGVVFEGDVVDARKADLLRRCHVMLFPTFHGEGLPNCILEGMLFGMSIVTRPVAAIPEIVQHGVNGLLAESLDAEPFADALRELVRDPAMLRRMAIPTAKWRYGASHPRSSANG